MTTTPPPVPMPELLPCPLCNKPAEIRNYMGNGWRIGCGTCQLYIANRQLRMGMERLAALMIERWNTRVPSPSVTISDEMVEAALSATVPLYYEDDKHEARVGDFIVPGIHKTNNERAIMRSAISAALSIQNKDKP